MALIPSARYPAQTDTDPAYPQGKARNASSFQDGTGTPLEADWLNDVWGFFQALLDAAGITPTGSPDAVGASQYLAAVQALAVSESLNTIIYRALQQRQLNLNGVTPPVETHLAASRDSVGRTLFVKGGTNGVFSIGDTSIVFLLSVSSGLTVCRSIAYNGTRHIAVGNGPSGNAFSLDDGATWAPGGALPYGTESETVVWDGTEFIASDGLESAHSTNGVAWTAPSGDDIQDAITATGSGHIAVLTPGTVVATNAKHVAVTTDHGATWVAAADIPSTLVGTVSSHVVGDGSGALYAFLKESGSTSIEVWRTTDAVTWTLISTVAGHVAIPSVGQFMADMCQDTGLLVVSTTDGASGTIASVSGDLGLTWIRNVNYDGAITPRGIAVANGRIFATGNTRVFATDPLLL